MLKSGSTAQQFDLMHLGNNNFPDNHNNLVTRVRRICERNDYKLGRMLVNARYAESIKHRHKHTSQQCGIVDSIKTLLSRGRKCDFDMLSMLLLPF